MKAFKTLLASSLILSAVFTGCANSKDSSEIKVGDVTIDLNDVSKEYSMNLDFGNDYLFETPKPIDTVSVNIPTGNIVIEHSGDDKSGFSLDYKIYGNSEDTIREINEHIHSVSEIKDNTLIIKLVEAQTCEDLEPWLKKNYPDCRVEYDTYITVPVYVTNYNTVCGVGNISFVDMAGSFNTDVSVGNITFSGNEITGPSTIKCNTGNIQMNGNVYKAKTDISAETCNITFCLPLEGSDGADISVSANTGDINVTGIKNFETKEDKKDGLSQKLSINTENCDISFSTVTGKINIEKE